MIYTTPSGKLSSAWLLR